MTFSLPLPSSILKLPKRNAVAVVEVVVEGNNRNAVAVVVEGDNRIVVVVVYSFTIYEVVLKKKLSLGSMWDRCGIDVGSMKGRFRVDVGSMWSQGGRGRKIYIIK